MKIKLQTWGRVEKTVDGPILVKILSGRVIIQGLPWCPEGRHFKRGDSGYYIAPGSHLLIIAIEPSEIEWRPVVNIGFGGSVSRPFTGEICDMFG